MSKKIWISLFVAFLAYSVIVYVNCGETKAATPTAAVQRGWTTWQDKNCQSCHQIYGLGGYMGPDLTNVASSRETNYLRTFIQYGSGRMPNFKLNEHQVADVVAFLEWIDKSGNGIVPEENVHWSGTYVFEP